MRPGDFLFTRFFSIPSRTLQRKRFAFVLCCMWTFSSIAPCVRKVPFARSAVWNSWKAIQALICRPRSTTLSTATAAITETSKPSRAVSFITMMHWVFTDLSDFPRFAAAFSQASIAIVVSFNLQRRSVCLFYLSLKMYAILFESFTQSLVYFFISIVLSFIEIHFASRLPYGGIIKIEIFPKLKKYWMVKQLSMQIEVICFTVAVSKYWFFWEIYNCQDFSFTLSRCWSSQGLLSRSWTKAGLCIIYVLRELTLLNSESSKWELNSELGDWVESEFKLPAWKLQLPVVGAVEIIF